MNIWLAIFLGGGAGSVCRYGVYQVMANWMGKAFPYGTLVANVLSCIALGLILSVAWKSEQEAWKLMLAVGFCGGFSTFSTFSLESVELIKNGLVWAAIGNVLISILACFGIIYFLVRNT